MIVIGLDEDGNCWIKTSASVRPTIFGLILYNMNENQIKHYRCNFDVNISIENNNSAIFLKRSVYRKKNQ